MHVVFAHHEPIDATKARWVAICRTLASMARLTPVTWLTPDNAARVDAYFERELGALRPIALSVRTLPSLRKRLGLTLNGVFFRAARKAVAELKPDVLWLRSDKLAAYFAEKLDTSTPALVYEAHLVGELWAQDRGAAASSARKLARIEQAVYAKARGVAAITQGLLDEIKSRFAYTGQTALAPSAVDLELFSRRWSGIAKDTVVYVGTLQFWKGLGTLLEAMALTPGLRLRIIGDGAEKERFDLRHKIRELALDSRVELSGRMPQHALPEAISSAACAVHALPPEHSIAARFTSPLKLSEYMALGMPIVASDLPSVREVLVDDLNARLFEAGNARSLANTLTEVCTNHTLASRLSAQASQDARRYGYDARAKILLGLFERSARRRA
jgi:glycosyltransferase involved in cell wall biosynthesis